MTDPIGATEGRIPQSTALAEASPLSIAELLSRDPEGFSRQDRAVVVDALRRQRERWQAAEAAPKAPKQLKAVDLKSLSTKATAQDLGL